MACDSVFEVVQYVFQKAFLMLLLVGGFMLLMRRGRGPGPRRRSADPLVRSMSLLNERYASGEIDRDEYLERRAYLE